MVDDSCRSLTQKERRRRPGPDASLSPSSEVVTLAIFVARWGRFASERDSYRYAVACLPNAFPTLPDRSQSNRSVRLRLEIIEDTALHLATLLGARGCPYEALDSSAMMPVRDAKRRGEGWLAGYAYTSDGPTAWDGTTRDSACSCPAASPRSDHRLGLRLCFHQRPTAGRHFLRRAGSTER